MNPQASEEQIMGTKCTEDASRAFSSPSPCVPVLFVLHVELLCEFCKTPKQAEVPAHCLEERLNYVNYVRRPENEPYDLQLDLLVPIKPKIRMK